MLEQILNYGIPTAFTLMLMVILFLLFKKSKSENMWLLLSFCCFLILAIFFVVPMIFAMFMDYLIVIDMNNFGEYWIELVLFLGVFIMGFIAFGKGMKQKTVTISKKALKRIMQTSKESEETLKIVNYYLEKFNGENNDNKESKTHENGD